MISSVMSAQQRNFFRMPCWLSVRWRHLDGQAEQTARAFFSRTGMLPFQQEMGLGEGVASPSAASGRVQTESAGVVKGMVEDVRGDVSGGGLSFLLHHGGFSQGAVLVLQFMILGAELPTLTSVARVVRVRATKGIDRRGDRQQVFCEFMMIAAQDQDALVQYITQAQHALLRSQSDKRVSWGGLTQTPRADARDQAGSVTDPTPVTREAFRRAPTALEERGGQVTQRIVGVLQRMARIRNVLPRPGQFFGKKRAIQRVWLPDWREEHENAVTEAKKFPDPPAWDEENIFEESYTPGTQTVEVTLPFHWESIAPGLLAWIKECMVRDGKFPDDRALPTRVQAREKFVADIKDLNKTDSRLARLIVGLRSLLEAVSSRSVVSDEEDPFQAIIKRIDLLVVAMAGQDVESTTACCRVFQSYLKVLQQILDPRRQARVQDVEQHMRMVRKELGTCLALQRRKEKARARKQMQKLGDDLEALVKWVIRQDMVTLLGYAMTPVTVQMGPGEGPVVHFLVPAPPPVVDEILRLRFAVPEDPWYWLACVGIVAAVGVEKEEGTWYSIWCRVTVIQAEDQERLWHLVSDCLPSI
ncbi:MAG: PilZ domain-containing protein [Magnetococcales bacterium]|nr:PilZ domain-containing protein [Magnetococcales bacterium]MBF0322322.1 PilZ domain-containing protein [Magnetococcales bacterium]